MKKCIVQCLLALLLMGLQAPKTWAQIAAASQGGKLTSWVAFGLDQNIGKRWNSNTSLGFGRRSDPDNTQLFKRQGLVVVKEEISYKLNDRWRITQGFGLWARNMYSSNPPYDPTNPDLRDEIRQYNVISYRFNAGRTGISLNLRPELRYFFNPGFLSRWSKPFEFRGRYAAKAVVPLDRKKSNFIIINEEVFTAIDKLSMNEADKPAPKWTGFGFTENRLSAWYRHSFKKAQIDFDLGVMQQHWRNVGTPKFTNTTYLQMDFIVRNPFSRHGH